MVLASVRQKARGGDVLTLPEPCPICGKAVELTSVNEWETETGIVIHADIECETEPDIDGEEWPDWHAEHYKMPYVHWMPYEVRALKWLNANYRYDGRELLALAARATGGVT